MHPGMLCTVVRTVLRSWFKDNIRCPINLESIEIMPDEKPTTFSGDTFISIYGSDWSPVTDDVNVAMDYYLGVTCTITRRTTAVPMWQVGPSSYAKAYDGLSATVVEIMRALSHKTSVLQALWQLPEYKFYAGDMTDPIRANVIGELFEFLRFQGADANPQPVFADHFRAKNEHLAAEAGESIMGYTMSVTFGKARCGIFQ